MNTQKPAVGMLFQRLFLNERPQKKPAGQVHMSKACSKKCGDLA